MLGSAKPALAWRRRICVESDRLGSTTGLSHSHRSGGHTEHAGWINETRICRSPVVESTIFGLKTSSVLPEAGEEAVPHDGLSYSISRGNCPRTPPPAWRGRGPEESRISDAGPGEGVAPVGQAGTR